MPELMDGSKFTKHTNYLKKKSKGSLLDSYNLKAHIRNLNEELFVGYFMQ